MEIKRNFIENIIEGLDKKFIEENNILENEEILLSTCLNPCFKMDFFEENEKRIIREYFEKINNNSQIIITGRYGKGRKTNTQNNRNEFEIYLNQECISENSNFNDIIKYWEINKHNFPHLYTIAQKFFCALSSSCSSERLFSDAGNYITKKRSRMLMSTVESQCIIKSFILQNGIDIFLK